MATTIKNTTPKALDGIILVEDTNTPLITVQFAAQNANDNLSASAVTLEIYSNNQLIHTYSTAGSGNFLLTTLAESNAKKKIVTFTIQSSDYASYLNRDLDYLFQIGDYSKPGEYSGTFRVVSRSNAAKGK